MCGELLLLLLSSNLVFRVWVLQFNLRSRTSLEMFPILGVGRGSKVGSEVSTLNSDVKQVSKRLRNFAPCLEQFRRTLEVTCAELIDVAGDFGQNLTQTQF